MNTDEHRWNTTTPQVSGATCATASPSVSICVHLWSHFRFEIQKLSRQRTMKVRSRTSSS